MNKLYSDIEELKKDLKENGEILIGDFSKEAIENLDNDKWVFCVCTSRGNHIMSLSFPSHPVKSFFFLTFHYWRNKNVLYK